ncbi:hypothetical protein [Roseivivax jejudonensis]|uniref:hypothetical protein n=1 Tax=Roseivivax jejudonensis TaxID=1529041 RepID=UPI001179C4C4|nr:hypothetical protein [Roseivivax jejudonensis]
MNRVERLEAGRGDTSLAIIVFAPADLEDAEIERQANQVATADGFVWKELVVFRNPKANSCSFTMIDDFAEFLVEIARCSTRIGVNHQNLET